MSAGHAVTLEKFAIDLSTIAVDTGGSLTVKNGGSVSHNVAIKGTKLKTAEIARGASASIDVSSLEAGMYEAYCQIPWYSMARRPPSSGTPGPASASRWLRRAGAHPEEPR